MKLKGEKSHTVNRPELIERYGYDTKFAMHALRLGLQGIEMMQTRNLVLPIPEPDRSTLMAIRTGKLNYNEALALIDGTETKLRALVEGEVVLAARPVGVLTGFPVGAVDAVDHGEVELPPVPRRDLVGPVQARLEFFEFAGVVEPVSLALDFVDDGARDAHLAGEVPPADLFDLFGDFEVEDDVAGGFDLLE
jgi:hypothetical protein